MDHEYMQEVLKAYGFGPKFINWVKILNKNLTAEILVNGFKTDKITRVEKTHFEVRKI